MDRLLGTIVSRAMRRGMRGEPLWLAVGVGAWLVRRVRQKGDATVWKGKIQPGQRLVIRAFDPREPGGSAAVGG